MHQQTNILLIFLFVFFSSSLFAQGQIGKNSLNKNLEFYGDHIVYKGKSMQLGPKAFYIDGALTSQEASKYKFVFNSVNEAVKHLTDGTEADPMVLYIAPYVYWIDDPDDPAIRVPKSGAVPFGLEINCEWLKFYGLDVKNYLIINSMLK
jgi:hypothetical protein